MPAQTPVYGSYAEFYKARYRSFIGQMTKHRGLDLFNVMQTAGDFSDEATPDVTIIRPLSNQRVHADLGGGRFSAWSERHGFAVNPAGFANTIVVDQPHRPDALCIPFQTLKRLNPDIPEDGHFGWAHGGQVNDPAMSAMIERLWRIEPGAGSALEIETAIAWIGERLLHWRETRKTPDKPREALSARALALSFERLAAEDGVDALSALAALVGLSPNHYCRAFNAATGLPPHRWRIMRRIERARELLRATSLPIAEIAAMVGYDDPAYFARLFAQVSGCSPRRWREEARA